MAALPQESSPPRPGPTTLPHQISVLVDDWLKQDQDPSTRAQLFKLIESNDVPAITTCMTPRIAFGTAGLRARMGPGYAYMNNLTVIQASQGLAAYLKSTVAPIEETLLSRNHTTVEQRGVVIGHDARYNSSTFARLTAAAFASHGFKVHFLRQCHTPLVPFAIKSFRAAVGVMITASHNPKDDNGYKVYWSNACQIIPPHDAGITKSIMANLAVRTWDDDAWASTLDDEHLELLKHSYTDAVADLTEAPLPTVPKFTYTPLHGVGRDFLQLYLTKRGLSQHMTIVDEQAEPDPAFPTVKYPNPEEKGALDLAKQTADGAGSWLILANDPDADRFCVAEKVDGEWRQLSGNQTGVLLAAYMLDKLQSGEAVSQPLMLASTVTSRMIKRMADVERNAGRRTFDFDETLTGFKWLGNRAIELDAQGCNTLFAYEEALGYMFPSVVYDKDGIAAASVFLQACGHWHSQGLTPWTKLQTLYERYGYFEEADTYLRTPHPDVTNRIFNAVRACAPTAVGSRSIVRFIDLTVGSDSAQPGRVALLPSDPSAQMIQCELADDDMARNVRFTARGSGTEPKIKLYIEAMADDARSAKEAADQVLRALLAEWFHPAENGLSLP